MAFIPYAIGTIVLDYTPNADRQKGVTVTAPPLTSPPKLTPPAL
jgi:hypothetical protein